MSKKILIKEAQFIDFIKSFFRAKSDNKESKWLSQMRKFDSDLADKWAVVNDKTDELLYATRDYYLKRNKPEKAAEIDDLIKKYK